MKSLSRWWPLLAVLAVIAFATAILAPPLLLPTLAVGASLALASATLFAVSSGSIAFDLRQLFGERWPLMWRVANDEGKRMAKTTGDGRRAFTKAFSMPLMVT